jgi:hypothetical protein
MLKLVKAKIKLKIFLKSICKKLNLIITGILFTIAGICIFIYLLTALFLFGRDPVDASRDTDKFMDLINRN